MSILDPQWIPPRQAAQDCRLPAGWQQLSFEAQPFYLKAFPPHWELDFDGDEEPFFLNHRKQDTERRPRWLTDEQHEQLNALYMQIYAYQAQSSILNQHGTLGDSTDSIPITAELNVHLSDPASGQSTPPRLPPSYKTHLSGGPLHQSARRTLISPHSVDSEGSDDDVELASIDQLRQASSATLLDDSHDDSDLDIRHLTPAADVQWDLPGGWSQHRGAAGMYFVHTSSKRVTWTHPGWLQECYGLRLEELPMDVDVTVDELGLVFHDHRTRSACRSIASAPSVDSIPSLSSSLSDAVSLASSLGDMVTGAVSGAVRRVSALWTPSPVLPQFHEGKLSDNYHGTTVNSPPRLQGVTVS